MRAVRGFTLVETMVIVAILAILASVAMPSFLDSIRQARVQTTAEQVIRMINVARSEALKTNFNHEFLISDAGALVVQHVNGTVVESENVADGVAVTIGTDNSKITFKAAYGVPDPQSSSEIDITYTGAAMKTVRVNMLGVASICTDCE